MSKFIPRLAVTLVSLACAFVLTSRAEAEEVEPLPDKQGGSATTTKTEDVSTLLSSLSADDIRTAFEVERRLAVLASSLDEAARARAYEQFAVRVVSLAHEWCKAPYALESRLAEERVTPRIVPPSAETPGPGASSPRSLASAPRTPS